MLNDKVFIVTGGSAGFGLAISKKLVAAGARVGITGRTAATLEAAVEVLGHEMAYAAVAEPHGVLPPAAAYMRGIAKPGFAMVAFDQAGKRVACAGSIRNAHPESDYADQAQWGQLASDPARQGEGIARALGAMALIESHERLGARRFKTGIREGNDPSIRLCTSLGVKDSGCYIVAAMDPTAFRGDKLTK